jgi:hypothetical protein
MLPIQLSKPKPERRQQAFEVVMHTAADVIASFL